MAKYKSPGQKRKGWVRIISIALFALLTYGGSLVLGSLNTATLAWTENHGEATAVVTAKNAETEEYRNLKGRKRTRTHHYVSYDFQVEGQTYSNTVTASSSDYENAQAGDKLVVWYAADDPSLSDTAANIRSERASNDTVGNMLGVVPYTGPAALFIYGILTLLFVRESKNAMPDGFYTETSWLDVDDNYLVALDGATLVTVKLEEKLASGVQDAYQQGASLTELVDLNKGKNVTRIPLTDVDKVTSDHNSDVISIRHGDETHMVEFLTQALKAHALERLKPLLPDGLTYSEKHRTRLQAALPSMIMLAILVGVGYTVDMFLLQLLVGVATLVWVIPRLFSRLLDPTRTQQWFRPESDENTEAAS